MENTKIGFIGFGNMAQAMAKGLLHTAACEGAQIYACAGSFDKLKKTAAALGIQARETPKEVAERSDFIVIALKPYMVEAVIAPIADLLENKVVVSVVAGYNFEKYEQILKSGTHHISTIPNTPIEVGAGIMVCEQKHSLDAQELAQFRQIFGKTALIEMVPTEHVSIYSTLGGCTPAFTAMYMEALGDAGVVHGASRDIAYRIVAQMLCGTGKLYLESANHPGAMKDAVCSPGGTTIKGVAALEKGGFRSAVIEAIDAVES